MTRFTVIHCAIVPNVLRGHRELATFEIEAEDPRSAVKRLLAKYEGFQPNHEVLIVRRAA